MTMNVSDTSSTLTFSDPDELVEPNVWTSMLGLFCHTNIGIFVEALADEQVMGRIALSCHFAMDVLCDKSDTRCAQEQLQVAPLPSKWPYDWTPLLQ